MVVDCKQFVEVDAGKEKKKCFYYVQGGNCTIPENRWCIVAPPKEPAEITQLSHSTVSKFKDCRRYTWFDKFKRIKPKVRAQYFVQGSVLHDLTEGIYTHDLDATYDSVKERFDVEGSDNSKVETVKAIALMTSYIEYAGKNKILQFMNVHPEKEYVSEFNGMRIVARYDLLAKDDSMFVEHKFVGGTKTLDKVTKFQHADQLSMYFMLKEKAKKCVLNLVKKPGYQFNPAKETLQDYMNRVKKDITSYPGKYYRPVVLQRSEFDLVKFRDELEVTVNELMSIPREAKHFYKNPQSCYMMDCQFQSICETGVVDPEKYNVYVPSGKNKKLDNGKEEK